jgi:hypothetical protein
MLYICCIYLKKVPYGIWHLFDLTLLTKSFIWLQFCYTMMQIIIWSYRDFSKCLIQSPHCMFWKSFCVINLNAYFKMSYILLFKIRIILIWFHRNITLFFLVCWLSGIIIMEFFWNNFLCTQSNQVIFLLNWKWRVVS